MYCSNNTFGSHCVGNEFNKSCVSNNFKIGCDYNNFGEKCDSNVFGSYCNNNKLGYACAANTFGSNCQSNKFGYYCTGNIFGNYCEFNIFGLTYESPKSYYRNIIFDSGNCYIKLFCTKSTGSGSYYQNVRIGLGVNNTTTYKTISSNDVNQSCETIYKPADSKTISI
jgi:hypothetical protein